MFSFLALATLRDFCYRSLKRKGEKTQFGLQRGTQSMRVTTKKLGQIRSALFVNRQPWSLVRLGQVRFLLLGQLWIALDSSGQFWIVLDSFGQFWIVLDSGWLKKIAVNYLKQLFVWNLRYVQDSTTLAWIVREAQEKPKQKPKKPKWFLLLGQLRIVLDSSGQFWIVFDSQLAKKDSFDQFFASSGQLWIVLDSFGQLWIVFGQFS